MATSSIQLLGTMEWAKKFNFNRSSANGNFIEPALTSANIVMQTMLGAPFAWWFNRKRIGFITTIGQQDYTVFNYAASTVVKVGWYTTDGAGNSYVATTAGTTGSSAPTWVPTKGQTTTDGTVVWTSLGSLGVPEVSSTYSYAWIETASVSETTATQGTRWVEMETKQNLAMESKTSRPLNISGQYVDASGNVTFRLFPAPSASTAVVISMQQEPPLFTETSQIWAPIPDNYAHIYNWGFLAMMWMFADDPRFSFANAKFVSSLLSTNQGLSQTQLNIFLQNWQAVTGAPAALGQTQAQGYQARGNA